MPIEGAGRSSGLARGGRVCADPIGGRRKPPARGAARSFSPAARGRGLGGGGVIAKARILPRAHSLGAVMVKVETAGLAGIKIITPTRHGDCRGMFSEVYSRRALALAGIDVEFVQDNHAVSTYAGTLRGLHFQAPPFAQAKLVRVTQGRILDVAVDLRRSSRTFGRHFALELSAANWRQVLVPVGFAHGYMTLEPNTEVLYKVTRDYAPDHEYGLAWDDPVLGINWGMDADRAILSDKDRRHPYLAELPKYFD